MIDDDDDDDDGCIDHLVYTATRLQLPKSVSWSLKSRTFVTLLRRKNPVPRHRFSFCLFDWDTTIQNRTLVVVVVAVRVFVFRHRLLEVFYQVGLFMLCRFACLPLPKLERVGRSRDDSVLDLQRRLEHEQELRTVAEGEAKKLQARIGKLGDEITVLGSHLAQVKAECAAERTRATTERCVSLPQQQHEKHLLPVARQWSADVRICCDCFDSCGSANELAFGLPVSRRLQSLESQLVSAEQSRALALAKASNSDAQVRELQDQITALQGEKSTAIARAETLAEKVGDLTRRSHTAALELTSRQKQIRGLSSELAAQSQLLKDAEWQMRRSESQDGDVRMVT